MGKFGGEDLMKRHREVQQQKAQASWVEQQIFEKTMAKQMEQDASDDFAAQVEGITQLRTEIEQKEEGLRKELQMGSKRPIFTRRRRRGVSRRWVLFRTMLRMPRRWNTMP